MNLWWIALVAAVVLLEKLTADPWTPRASRLFLTAWGGALIVGVGG